VYCVRQIVDQPSKDIRIFWKVGEFRPDVLPNVIVVKCKRQNDVMPDLHLTCNLTPSYAVAVAQLVSEHASSLSAALLPRAPARIGRHGRLLFLLGGGRSVPRHGLGVRFTNSYQVDFSLVIVCIGFKP
jgi:hypothetical protein